MNEIAKSGGPEIKNLIYEIRGKQVMLDSDLAKLYQCKNGTKAINQAVRRHPDRFPEDFCFQLTRIEYENLKSHSVTSNPGNNYGGVRKMPYAFTEQGVSMLATVLKTEIAAQMSIFIMRAFVAMRHLIGENLLEQKYINDVVLEDHKLIKEHTKNIKLLQESFNEFKEKRKDNAIFFNGQFYDSYSTILDIFDKAKKNLIIIDAYADHTLLDIIKRLKANVVLVTTKVHLSAQDIEKYNQQYGNLLVLYDNTFHDRYFILDNKIVYHCGASINRIGYKTFSITKINDEEIITALLDKIDTRIKTGG